MGVTKCKTKVHKGRSPASMLACHVCLINCRHIEFNHKFHFYSVYAL